MNIFSLLDPRFDIMLQDELFFEQMTKITPTEELEAIIPQLEQMEKYELCQIAKLELDERANVQR